MDISLLNLRLGGVTASIEDCGSSGPGSTPGQGQILRSFQCDVLKKKLKRVYVSHSTSFDYKNKLYAVLSDSELNNNYIFILPHKKGGKVANSIKLIIECDLVLAEVSYPSTGQGIELGWANYARIPIICIFRRGHKISNSLNVISRDILKYGSNQDLIKKLRKIL